MTTLSREQASKQAARQIALELGDEHSARLPVDSPLWIAGRASVTMTAVCSDHRSHRFRVTVEEVR